MTQKPLKKLSKVDDIMTQMHSLNADDPDMMAKLNEIALRVAEAQGKKSLLDVNNSSVGVDVDPMEELGCEGCQ